jgi:hypothetical protein
LSKYTADGRRSFEVALERLVEEIMHPIAKDALCTVQEWDGRVDCTVWLSDGRFFGEMVGLSELNNESIRAVAMRLKLRQEDSGAPLHNEIMPPIRISKT